MPLRQEEIVERSVREFNKINKDTNCKFQLLKYCRKVHRPKELLTSIALAEHAEYLLEPSTLRKL